MHSWKSNKIFFVLLLSAVFIAGCTKKDVAGPNLALTEISSSVTGQIKRVKNEVPVIHVTVALCDNENQGIVAVPEHLGDGEDPARNLYWGAAYGIETYFSKSTSWKELPAVDSPKDEIIKRIAFKHNKSGAILVADAFRGIEIKTAIRDFLDSTVGRAVESIELDGKKLQIGGGADVIAYVGHNGLMDFDLAKPAVGHDPGVRDSIILACFSKRYFSPLIKDSGTSPALWTTNFMAPEAYILHDSLEGRLSGETGEQIRERGAKAYAKYQKISLKAAKGLLVTGW